MKQEQGFANSTYVYTGLLIVALFFVGSRFYPMMTKVKINTSSIKDGETVNDSISKTEGDIDNPKEKYLKALSSIEDSLKNYPDNFFTLKYSEIEGFTPIEKVLKIIKNMLNNI